MDGINIFLTEILWDTDLYDRLSRLNSSISCVSPVYIFIIVNVAYNLNSETSKKKKEISFSFLKSKKCNNRPESYQYIYK